MKPVVKNPFLASALVAVASQSPVQAVDWNTSTGLWGTGTNWAGNLVPSGGDVASVQNGGTAQIVAGDNFTNGETWIGNGGNGNLLQTGGTLTSQNWFVIGRGGSTGIYNMSGGTLNHTGGNFYVGDGGAVASMFTMSGNAVVNAVNNIAVGPNGTGVMTVGGTSQFTSTGEMNVGAYNANGKGTLTVKESGSVSIKYFVGVGRDGGTGVLNIEGGTFTKTNSGDRFSIANQGDNSTGTVNLSGGAISVNADLQLGGGTNNTATLNISGSGALTVSNTTILYSAATGATGANLIHQTGGIATYNGEVCIGQGAASVNQTNTYNLESGMLNANSNLFVGREGGTGAFTVIGGTVTTAGLLIVGNNPGSNGTMTINGAGAIVNVNNEMFIGNYFGTGSATISAGQLNTSNALTVGRDQGTGAFTISGGTVTTGPLVVGQNSGSNGTLTVNGAGAIVNVDNDLYIGNNFGTGSATISAGQVNAGGWIGVGRDGATGTLTINGTGKLVKTSTGGSNFEMTNFNNGGHATVNLDGGLLSINQIDLAGGAASTAVINFNGGTLQMTVDNGNFINHNSATAFTANVKAGGAVIDTNGHAVTFGDALVADGVSTGGGLTKTGAGSLNLAGVGNSYTGDTKVTAGTLTLNAAFLADTSNITIGITIGSGAILDLQTLAATDTVKTLVIPGETQAIGTWGSLASLTATHKTAAITGDGILNVTAIAPSGYGTWIAGYPSLTGANALPGADPDMDGFSNLAEFALKGDPTSGANQGLSKVVIQDASAPVGNELTLVTAVRRGATFASGPGNSQTATKDGVSYTIQGSLDLNTFTSAVSHISNSNTATGLPDLTGTDWEYHTFKLNASEGLVGKGFLRDRIESAP